MAQPKKTESPERKDQSVMVKLTKSERATFEEIARAERRPLATTVALLAIRGAAMEAKR